MVCGAFRQEAGPHKRWRKTLKAKLAQGGPGLSPLSLDGSCDGQAGGWTVLTVAKSTQEES